MSSRRRPILPSSTIVETPVTDLNVDQTVNRRESRLKLRPNSSDFDLTNLSQITKPAAHYRPVHPATTDYGPETLKNFLDNEGQALKDLECRFIDLERKHNQYLHGLLQTLTDTQSHLNASGRNDVSPPRTTIQNVAHTSDYHSSFSPRQSRQGLAPDTIERQDSESSRESIIDLEDVTWYQESRIHSRSQKNRSTKSIHQNHNGLQHSNIEDGDNDVLFSSLRDEPSRRDLEALNNKSRYRYRSIAIPKQQRSHEPHSLSYSLPGALSMIDITNKAATSVPQESRDIKTSLFLDLSSSSSSQLTLRNQIHTYDDEYTVTQTRPRASSFEDHATQSRQSLRSKTKVPDADSQIIGASPRPRKMSASLLASLNAPSSPPAPRRPTVPPINATSYDSMAVSLPVAYHEEDPFDLDQTAAIEDMWNADQVNENDTQVHSQAVHDPALIGQANGSYERSTLKATYFDSGVTRQTIQMAKYATQERNSLLNPSGTSRRWTNSRIKSTRINGAIKFDYRTIIPEQLLAGTEHGLVACEAGSQRCGDGGRSRFAPISQSLGRLVPMSTNMGIEPIDKSETTSSSRGITWDIGRQNLSRPISFGEPPFCPPSMKARTTLPNVIWEEGVLDYLSSAEIRTLRLVCKSIAEDLEPYVFRNVVTKFAPSMFNLRSGNFHSPVLDLNASDSMLKKYGSDINKFGIAFEVDLNGLASAPFKTTETTVNAWFGRYRWPVKDYPYFASLRQIDQILDDDRRFLTQALGKLTNCSELALSLDSGHGWLEGPDVSDLELYRQQSEAKSPVFGKTFSAPDKRYEDGLRRLFTWAQINTIDENIKHFASSHKPPRDEIARLLAIVIRSYDSYRIQTQQPDFEPHLHTGGVVAESTPNNDPQAREPTMANPNILPYAEFLHGLIRDQVDPVTIAQRIEEYNRLNPSSTASEKSLVASNIQPIQPQWPIIFNGFNLASECRGDSAVVQSRVARPSKFPLLPGHITEAQAQWMMETAWIQRTFLTAYTDAVRLNGYTLRSVHTLTLAQMSSGLLPCVSQEAFWTALSGLRKVKILIKPDWRVEHIPGDKLYLTSMLTDPVKAAKKFTEFLRKCVSKLENLYTLHIGYVGGGEHQVGMFGRNQHVLPAPITQSPREWLLAHNGSTSTPDNNSILVFHHVRNLTFENCWFSPRLLETFMMMSRDTSLHFLTLDSVSLTSRINSTRADGPFQTVRNNLKCAHGPGAWLNEDIPDNASWVHVIDNITPGKTILDHKYSAQMIDEEIDPKPDPEFRGNIQRISLKSCGYVKISGISSSELNQNDIVVQNSLWNTLDEGLRTRASNGYSKIVPVDISMDNGDGRPPRPGNITTTNRAHRLFPNTSTTWTTRLNDTESTRESACQGSSSRFVMLGGRPGQQTDSMTNITTEVAPYHTNLTGVLTQCIHPVEKRVLEQCWGMQFGWKDDMRRWEAVEDGWFIGGTGRFTGTVYRDEDDQARAVAAVQASSEAEAEATSTVQVANGPPSATNTTGPTTTTSPPANVTTDTRTGFHDMLMFLSDDDDYQGMDDNDDGLDSNHHNATTLPQYTCHSSGLPRTATTNTVNRPPFIAGSHAHGRAIGRFDHAMSPTTMAESDEDITVTDGV